MSALQASRVEPILTAFWDLFDWLAVRVPARPGINLASDVNQIALNLCHFEAVARHFERPLPASIPELKSALEQSRTPKFVNSATYNCHDGRRRHCMIFGLAGAVT